jgi:hypothetical protein
MWNIEETEEKQNNLEPHVNFRSVFDLDREQDEKGRKQHVDA